MSDDQGSPINHRYQLTPREAAELLAISSLTPRRRWPSIGATRGLAAPEDISGPLIDQWQLNQGLSPDTGFLRGNASGCLVMLVLYILAGMVLPFYLIWYLVKMFAFLVNPNLRIKAKATEMSHRLMAACMRTLTSTQIADTPVMLSLSAVPSSNDLFPDDEVFQWALKAPHGLHRELAISCTERFDTSNASATLTISSAIPLKRPAQLPPDLSLEMPDPNTIQLSWTGTIADRYHNNATSFDGDAPTGKLATALKKLLAANHFSHDGLDILHTAPALRLLALRGDASTPEATFDPNVPREAQPQRTPTASHLDLLKKHSAWFGKPLLTFLALPLAGGVLLSVIYGLSGALVLLSQQQIEVAMASFMASALCVWWILLLWRAFAPRISFFGEKAALETKVLADTKLRWDGSVLAQGSEGSIDLTHPFVVHLSRERLDNGLNLLNVEVRPRSTVADSSRRIQFRCKVADHSALDRLPTQQGRGPIYSQDELSSWIWPLLNTMSMMHGESLPWMLTTEDSQTRQVEVSAPAFVSIDA